MKYTTKPIKTKYQGTKNTRQRTINKQPGNFTNRRAQVELIAF